jgi:hypothetical protein
MANSGMSFDDAMRILQKYPTVSVKIGNRKADDIKSTLRNYSAGVAIDRLDDILGDEPLIWPAYEAWKQFLDANPRSDCSAECRDLIQEGGESGKREAYVRTFSQVASFCDSQIRDERAGVTRGFKWSAAGDACPLCRRLNGLKLTFKEVRLFRLPHPACRCDLLPWFDDPFLDVEG